MPASDSTKLQINMKLDDQTLINIYLDEPLSLPTALGVLRESAQDITGTRALLNGAITITQAGAAAPPAANVTAPQQAAPPAWAAQPQAPQQPQPAANPAAGAGPGCPHGPMIWKEGTGRASGKPYKGWFCSQRGSDCSPQFA